MGDVQGVMEDTQFDYERYFSVFSFTLCTFLPKKIETRLTDERI